MFVTPFDSRLKNLNKKFVKITTELTSGKVNFYGEFNISEDFKVINVIYSQASHDYFPDNFSDNYRIQLLQPGAGIIMLCNFERLDIMGNLIVDDQFQINGFNIQEV
jgi:hypothetical protein